MPGAAGMPWAWKGSRPPRSPTQVIGDQAVWLVEKSATLAGRGPHLGTGRAAESRLDPSEGVPAEKAPSLLPHLLLLDGLGAMPADTAERYGNRIQPA